MSSSTKIRISRTHPLVEAAQKHPKNTAVTSAQCTLNYADLLSRAKALGQVLNNRGITSGDVMVLGNLAPEEMIQMIWASSLIGAIAFPVNTRFPYETLLPLLNSINPAQCISDRTLISDLTIKFNDLHLEIGTGQFEDAEFNPHAPASLLMTSGSGGSSRIIQHSYRNHLTSAIGSNLNIELGTKGRWLLELPLYHIGGLSILYRIVLAGSAVVLPDQSQPITQSITKYRATHISLVATQLQRILKESQSERVLSGMEAILLGGSAIPKSLLQNALSKNIPIHVSYGSTEMSSQITTTSANDRDAVLKNSGTLLAGRDLLISHAGEILVRGETLAQGYRDESGLHSLADDEGWYHTGDVGYLNVRGELTVTGRVDNQFISGGENIQPEHIEMILTSIPGIVNAVVLPEEDDEFGFRPVAYIQGNLEIPQRPDIEAQLRTSLPGYMIPVDFFELPDELANNGLKISRKALSEMILHKNKHLHQLK